MEILKIHYLTLPAVCPTFRGRVEVRVRGGEEYGFREKCMLIDDEVWRMLAFRQGAGGRVDVRGECGGYLGLWLGWLGGLLGSEEENEKSVGVVVNNVKGIIAIRSKKSRRRHGSYRKDWSECYSLVERNRKKSLSL